ncbi:hypothetical protein SAMN05421734_104101 [Pelagirhabdus alkalitolerans]|uniref:Uncharacterized protein n=1 Tax=Pelagirhabdus alkalitolerans TaxID=1612202 RepID=A0A1G6IRP7_9BACI|nr:hypothetical protein [Pelagirhabdus alkalitolerans]SDC08416.1 hypothetical protein SAMN05421734_104101 [Pelagirhabdus alkalitolerans]
MENLKNLQADKSTDVVKVLGVSISKKTLITMFTIGVAIGTVGAILFFRSL